MVNPQDGPLSSDSVQNNTRLSLDPLARSAKPSRVLSNPTPSDPSRPRSRTQSSEQGIVTVFSGVQRPPPLDPDLDTLNRLPRYRPLVLAPSNNRLAGLFHSGYRYIEPTAEQLKLDETELTGMCFSFRDYISNRVQHVCDRQAQFVNAAKYIGARTSESNTKLMHTYQLSRSDQEGLSVLKSIQRQTEKSYELVQQILHDLERLEAALPVNERFFGADSDAPEEFPCLAKMLGQRRRHSLPASSPHSSTALRRQIAARKAGMPVFPPRSTSISSSQYSRSGSLASYTESHSKQTRVSPYQLPVGMRQASTSISNHPYSKCSIDRRSQSSLHVTASSANNSAPASPISDCGHRVSFDGEEIHSIETASLSVLASHNGPRSLRKRNATGSGIPKRPVSALSAYMDPRGSHSRGEVSLSTQQVLWSPQMSLGVSDSAFSNPRYRESSPHLVLANVEEEYGTYTDSVPGEQSCADSASNANPEPPYDATCNTVKCNEDDEKKLLPSNILYRSGRRASVVSPSQPAASATSTKGLQLLVPLNKGAVGATVSPKSLPRGLSLRSNSSLGSSPSTSSFLSPTPITSPSVPGNTNSLSVVTSNDPPQPNAHSLSTQYPSEATRMLKQVIREHSDISSLDEQPLSVHPTVQSHILDKSEPAMLTPEDVDADSKRLSSIDNTMCCPRSRSSSLAHSQPSTAEDVSGFSDHIRSESPAANTSAAVATCSAFSEQRIGADAPRGTGSWSRSNTERLSTWSSSSAKTLSEGMYGSRVSSIEDPLSRTAKQQLLTAAALSKLSVPATVASSRPPRSSSLSVSSSFGESSANSLSSQYTGNNRHRAHIRAKIDLGLSMRSDLERRVRSFSESEGNMPSSRDGRPHSSMGFHETVSGAHVLRVRPDGIHARHNSPHSASLRLLRSDKYSAHRLSVASIGSSHSSNRNVSISSERLESSDSAIHGGVSSSGSGREGEQSAASSYSSQATEPLPPTPPNSLARPSSGSAATAISTVTALASKRRAQTTNQHYNQIKRAL
ncbi:hypothetical protein IW140_002251 [Coemansia sp. RSA 1813]|nr:hypothetical protein IW140_002251 [Coemansia sp. RSA 1813]